MKNILISLAALVLGLAAITIISELIESLIIGFQANKSLTELSKKPDEYFAIRNQPFNVTLKIIYNTLAAFIGGFVCCVIAKRYLLRHIIILIVIQVIGFIYGMTVSEYANTTPVWLWLLLILITVIGILGGYWKYHKRLKNKLLLK